MRTIRADKTRIVDWRVKPLRQGSLIRIATFWNRRARDDFEFEGTNTGRFSREVKERVAQMERDKWITGRGWIETFWKPPQFPTRADLDKIAPDNPVF